MKTAKWIIVLIVGAVGAYLILTQAQLKNQEAITKEQKIEGVQIKKRYDENGILKADAEYLNGMKHGIAHNYYPDGSVHSVIHYKNNVKEGISTWFYEDGKPYRITPFKNGKKNGIQKKFYKTGKLMAEVPYENGNLIEGTKEYNENGKRISEYPEMLIKDRDLSIIGAKYYLDVSFSKNTSKPTLYLVTKNEKKLFPTEKENGIYRFTFISIPENTEFMEVTIYAEIKSKLQNPVLITKKHRIVLGG